jgi:polar amino acid transport system permease protein
VPLLVPELPDWVGPVFRYVVEHGLPFTLKIAGASVVGSAVLGIALGTLLTIRFLPLRGLIRLYIEVWRGLPLIVTLFLIVFALPQTTFHITFRPWVGAAIALTLWGSAQIAEATRGAIESIPREQHEAASALGFGWVGRHVNVILPQGLRRLLPPLVSLLVGVIQNTTLAALVSVTEVLFAAKQQVERLAAPPPAGVLEQHGFAIYAGVMAAFFIISFPLTRLAAYLERRLV